MFFKQKGLHGKEFREDQNEGVTVDQFLLLSVRKIYNNYR